MTSSGRLGRHLHLGRLAVARALRHGRDRVAVRRRVAHRDQVDDEHQVLVGADALRRAAVLAVGLGGGDDDLAALAHLHAGHAGLEAGDQLALAEADRERLAVLERVREDLAVVGRRADQVDRQVLVGAGLAGVLLGLVDRGRGRGLLDLHAGFGLGHVVRPAVDVADRAALPSFTTLPPRSSELPHAPRRRVKARAPRPMVRRGLSRARRVVADEAAEGAVLDMGSNPNQGRPAHPGRRRCRDSPEREGPRLEVEQEALALHAAAVAREAAVRPDHPVARDDDRDRVPAVGQADGPEPVGGADARAATSP